MDLIDTTRFKLPVRCLMTDDPFRVKMIAAHYLDNVEIFTETRGQLGLSGNFNSMPLVVFSAGIGKTSMIAYLTELCSKHEIHRVIYLGDCVTKDSSLSAGSIAYIQKAYENEKCYAASENLINFAENFIKNNSVIAIKCAATTEEKYYIEKKYTANKDSRVLDFASSTIYKFKADYNIEALSILSVYHNLISNEKMEESVRQSGCASAVMLALQTATYGEAY